MKNLIMSFFLISITAMAAVPGQTARFPQFANKDVDVWKTVIEPGQALTMHRFNHSYILVPLTDVKLKVTNKKGVVTHVEWKKGTAYSMPADKAGEFHTDHNEGSTTMEMMVIQMKK
ncbi:MAG: hypothetical protein V4534_04075 [Myxococcota bacterium]